MAGHIPGCATPLNPRLPRALLLARSLPMAERAARASGWQRTGQGRYVTAVGQEVLAVADGSDLLKHWPPGTQVYLVPYWSMRDDFEEVTLQIGTGRLVEGPPAERRVMVAPSRQRATLSMLAPRISTLDLRTARPGPKTAAPFYRTPAWRALMARLLQERGRRCEPCGRSGTRIFGDHIRELQDGGAGLDPRNIQLLCGACHTIKTARARAARTKGRPPATP